MRELDGRAFFEERKALDVGWAHRVVQVAVGGAAAALVLAVGQEQRLDADRSRFAAAAEVTGEGARDGLARCGEADEAVVDCREAAFARGAGGLQRIAAG